MRPRRQQVEAFLTELYHGKPKACDLARFMEKMAVGEGGRVSHEDIRIGMDQLVKEVCCVLKLLLWTRSHAWVSLSFVELMSEIRTAGQEYTASYYCLFICLCEYFSGVEAV